MILSVHQPNFFPWLPYFKKIQDSDVFVFLGNVQFARRQYQNRFFYSGKWHTMSVNSGSRSDIIIDKKYVNSEIDWLRIKSNLKSYDLAEYDAAISTDMYKTNTSIIRRILSGLQINTPIYDDVVAPGIDPNERIIRLCKIHGADEYLTGPSGKKYLDQNLFSKNSIRIIDFNYLENDRLPIITKL